jgi:hypothetical protein
MPQALAAISWFIIAIVADGPASLAANPKLSHGKALRKSMLVMIDDLGHPYLADPKLWAPFVVVSKPAKHGK